MNPNTPFDSNRQNDQQQLTPESFAFMNAYDVPPVPPKKNKKIWLFIGIGLVVAIGIVITMIVMSGRDSMTAQPTGQSNVNVLNYEAIRIPYLADWQVIEIETDEFAGIIESTDGASVLYYGKTQMRDTAVGIDAFPSGERNDLTTRLAEENKIVGGGACQQGFSQEQNKVFENNQSFGVDLLSVCDKDGAGNTFAQLDRFIYVGDGNLYQVSLKTTKDYWNTNKESMQDLVSHIAKGEKND